MVIAGQENPQTSEEQRWKEQKMKDGKNEKKMANKKKIFLKNEAITKKI